MTEPIQFRYRCIKCNKLIPANRAFSSKAHCDDVTFKSFYEFFDYYKLEDPEQLLKFAAQNLYRQFPFSEARIINGGRIIHYQDSK